MLRIARQQNATLSGGTVGLKGGTAGGNKKGLRQVIRQEIQKDQLEIQKVSARLQQDKTSDPSRVARGKKLWSDRSTDLP